MDIYTENLNNEVTEMENDRRPDVADEPAPSMDQIWIQDPIDISEEPVVANTVTNVPRETVISEDEIKNWHDNNKNTLGKNDIPAPKKDWPGNRCYLYGLTSEYYPIVYRYIQKQSVNVGTIKHVVDDISTDYPNVILIYIVDNSKDIHEAFNRARTKYRPSEDRAIFKTMLEAKGVKLFERQEDK